VSNHQNTIELSHQKKCIKGGTVVEACGTKMTMEINPLGSCTVRLNPTHTNPSKRESD
jgi:glycine cleavage system protein P-like pyridoxal-binding family